MARVCRKVSILASRHVATVHAACTLCLVTRPQMERCIVLMHERSCPHVINNMSSCYHACVLMSICMCPHVFHFYVGVGNMVKIPTLMTPARRILWVVLENFHTVTLVCPTIIGWNKLLAREASGYIAPRQQRRSTKRA